MLDRLSHILDRISSRVVGVAGWIVACFMSGMTLAIFLAIVSRFIIKIPLPWTEELSRYLMVWVAFLAGGLGLRKGVHVGVLFLVQKAPETWAKGIGLVTDTALLIFFLFLIVQGVHMATLVASQMSPVLQISMAWVYASLPVGAILFALFVIEALVNDLKGLWE